MSFHVLSYGLVVLGIAMNSGHFSVFIVIHHSYIKYYDLCRLP